jgi:hypothetical protein
MTAISPSLVIAIPVAYPRQQIRIALERLPDEDPLHHAAGRGALFGFSESGCRAAVVIAIVAEVATVAVFAPVAAVSLALSVFERAAGREAASFRQLLVAPSRAPIAAAGLTSYRAGLPR